MALSSKQGLYLNAHEYVEVPDSEVLDFTSNFTVYIRVMPTQSVIIYDQDTLVDKKTHSTPVVGWTLMQHPDDNKVYFNVSNSSASSSINSVTPLEMFKIYDVVATYDSSNHGRLWINGNLEADADMVAFEVSHDVLRLNCRYSIGKGIIYYKVIIWSRVLSDDEIKDLGNDVVPTNDMVLWLDYERGDFDLSDRTGLNSVNYTTYRWVHEPKDRLLKVTEL